jgi:hypothetical protein
MRALSIFIAFFVISCATAPQKRFTTPENWTLFATTEDLKEFFGEAYSDDMEWAIVKNDRSAYIVISSDEHVVSVSGEALNDAIRNYLERGFDKKRNVFGLYDYTYAIYDGAVLRGEKLVATEKFRDVLDGVECEMISNVLFYRYGDKARFTFVSMVSLPDETESNLPVLKAATEWF